MTRPRPGGTASTPEAGQATVELALGLPVVLMAALLVVQVGLVLADQLRVVGAAREAARAAAVDARPGAPRAGAVGSSGLDPSRLAVTTSARGPAGGTVTATVRYRSATDVALVGPLVPDVEVVAAATMRVEAPG